MLRRLMLLLVLGTAVPGCTRVDAPDYFPLDPGLRWEYAKRESSRAGEQVERFEMRNLTPATRDGQRYLRRLASDGNEYWLQLRDERLERVGVRTAIDFEPRMDASARMVMPRVPAVGMAWDVETRPYVLERIEPFRERFSQDDSKRIQLRMQVMALDEVVEVPAGRFERCLRLEGSGLLNVLADARIGASPVPVTHTEWYAPGVGLIKLQRTETLDTQAIVGGSVTLELLRFES